MASTTLSIVTLTDGMAFEAKASSGHVVLLDSTEAAGGRNLGPRPLEMLLMGLGGCTGMDVISILRKMRLEVTSYEVKVTGERAQEHPKVYTDISVEHVVKGRGLTAQSIRRAVELSATTYCSASAMLSKAAQVVHSYRIVDADSGAEQTGTLG